LNLFDGFLWFSSISGPEKNSARSLGKLSDSFFAYASIGASDNDNLVGKISVYSANAAAKVEFGCSKKDKGGSGKGCAKWSE
jgi:hypothetical protein